MTEQEAAELFQAVFDLEPEARTEYLDKACAGNPALRARVEELLEADEKAEGFLESPLQVAMLLAEAKDPAAALVGQTIGTYRIRRIIASGGMGTVYEAQQERPRRRVALKVLKAGLASRQLLQRFAHEAEILGRLRHPGIAQIFEADVDRQRGNLPFFVMEYVPGAKTITAFAEDNDLTIRQKLDLFVTVCDTIHFGHQHGVIHRDLKPGNILVDEESRTRVIDFGVARVTDADMTLLSRQTDAGQIVGTLRYMSPEQCEGDSTQVDIRCDVYALGVVLYELLTGELPYDVTTPSPFDIPRVIREEEPRRLSSINTALRGDVDAIVLKALEKECHRRYQSAHSLGQDIRRHLAGDPIEARRHRKWYLLKKTLAKHRVAFGMTAAFVLLIVVSAVVLGFLYRQADTQRQLAESRAEDLRISAYFNTIALAQNAWESTNTPQLKELLRRCPPDLRGWEWYFLKKSSDECLMTLTGHQGALCALTLSPNGHLLVSGGWDDHKVRAWDAVDGKLLRTLDGHQHRVGCVACSPDGQLYISGSHDKTLRTWDAATGQQLHLLSGHTRIIRRAVFTPDSRRIISSDEAGSLIIWDTASGELVCRLVTLDTDVPALTVSPAGDVLVSGDSDGMIRMWDMTDGRLLRTIQAHDHRLMALLFSDDGRRLYSGSWDKRVKVWDAATGELQRTIGPHDSEINSLDLGPGGKLLAVAGGTTIRIFDATSGRTIRTFLGHEHSVNSVLFSPDGSRLFSCSHDGTIRVWDTTGITSTGVLGTDGGDVEAVACSASRQLIASAGRAGKIKIFKGVSHHEVANFPSHEKGVTSLAFSPDSRRLASGGVDRTVRIWSGPEWVEHLVLSGHQDIVCAVDWSPDGAAIASGGLDQTVILWSADTGQRLRTIHCGGPILSVSFSPDGKRLATGGREDKIHLWDSATGQPLGALSGHHGPARAVAWSPDGKRLVSCGDDWQLRLWDARSGQLLHILKGHHHRVLAANFSPDGSRIVSASYDKTLMVWDSITGQTALTLRGHEYPVNSVTFSPDGRTIISGSADRTVRIWDAGPDR